METAQGFTERFQAFLTHFDLNPNKLADSLGDKAKVKYHRYLIGETEPGFSTMELIATKYPISLDWLVLGKGSMIRGEVIEATVVESTPPPPHDSEKQNLLQQIALLQKENQMLKAENEKVWRLALPESVQKELNFLRASSHVTATAPIGFRQRGRTYTLINQAQYSAMNLMLFRWLRK